MQTTILGHGNVALSIIIDLLWNQYNKKASALVIKNVPLGNSREETAAFEIDQLNTKIIEHTEWNGIGANYFIGAFQPLAKQKIRQWFHDNFQITDDQYTTLVHPNSAMAYNGTLGPGSIIGPGSVVAPFSSIGKFCSINRNVSIGHHTSLEAFTTVNPGANIAGFNNLKQGALIGMGANILEGLEIGENSVVGAGSLVTKSIPANVIAYGSPAKVIRDR